MQFSAEKTAEVKQWIVKKLEDISDADSDVLADYVLALLTSDEPEENIRASCLENLDDFLKDNTKEFVNEIFKRYGPPPTRPASLPIKPPTQPRAHAIAAINPLPTPNYPSGSNGNAENGTKNSMAGRKRSHAEQNGHVESFVSHQPPASDRPFKPQKLRRGGRKDQQFKMQPAAFPPPQPFFPPFPMFDPNDPMAVMAWQAMMQSFGMGPSMRCQDYDRQGFCPRGNSCPFLHGESEGNALVRKENGSKSKTGKPSKSQKQSRRSRRAEFSDPEPNFDKSITTIVVEHIPEENFDDKQIQEFFSQYGQVVEVTKHAYKHLALVKYDSYTAARRAYESPKPIFDNRFVKIYWYKPGVNGVRTDQGTKANVVDQEPDFDPEVFAKQQEAAQKAFEERMEKVKANMEARRELQAQQRQLLEKHAAEKQQLLVRIAKAEAKRHGKDDQESRDDDISADAATDPKALEKEKVQKALREQLALLEAEAMSLGIDPNAPLDIPYPRSSTGYSYSNRGNSWSRGSYRGRGGAFGSHRPSGVLRLDNRSKRVAISLPKGVVLDTEKDEALRQYLLSVSEFESIDQDPEKPQGEGMIVTYRERYQAEMLIARGRDIPEVGTVEMKWVDGQTSTSTSSSNGKATQDVEEDEDMSDGEINEVEDIQHNHNNDHSYSPPAEIDYDVASEDEYDIVT